MRIPVLLSLLLFPGSVYSQSLPLRFDSLFQAFHEKGHFDGAVLVASKGEIVYQKQFGYANRQFKVSAGPDTRYPIASITKLYTAILILQLQESGKVQLDHYLSEYLSDALKTAGQRITVRHLLTHASGLPGDKLDDYYTKSVPLPGAFVRTRIKDTLHFTPGSKFNYNNIDYIVLGAIIEKVTGKSWARVLQENILDRLGVVNTGVIRLRNVILGLAYGYHNYSFGSGTAADTLYNDENPHFENYATAGGMYATAADIFRLDQALYDSILLRQATVAEMYSPSASLGYSKYARGWWDWGVILTKSVWHPGKK